MLPNTATAFHTVPFGDAITTFAASTQQTNLDVQDTGIPETARVDALVITVQAKISSGSETGLTISTAAERNDLISAILGNVLWDAASLGTIVDNVDWAELIRIGYLVGSVPRTNLPALGQTRLVETTGEYDLQIVWRLPLCLIQYALGDSFAPFAGFFTSGGVRLTTGDGSASLGGKTWAVSTSANEVKIACFLDVALGLKPVARPTLQYYSDSFTSLDRNTTDAGLQIAQAQLTDAIGSLAFGNPIATGIQVQGGGGSILEMAYYDPHVALARFSQGLPGAGAQLHAFYNQVGSVAGGIADDANGVGADKFVPMFAASRVQGLNSLYAGPLQQKFGSAYTATHKIGGVRVVKASNQLKGLGACRCLPQGTAIASAPAPIAPYVGLA